MRMGGVGWVAVSNARTTLPFSRTANAAAAADVSAADVSDDDAGSYVSVPAVHHVSTVHEAAWRCNRLIGQWQVLSYGLDMLQQVRWVKHSLWGEPDARAAAASVLGGYSKFSLPVEAAAGPQTAINQAVLHSGGVSAQSVP